MLRRYALVALLPCVIGGVFASSQTSKKRPEPRLVSTDVQPDVRRGVAAACLSCHTGKSASGGLDLSRLAWKPSDSANFALWSAVHDRVAAGEMPPPGGGMWSKSGKASFLGALNRQLVDLDRRRSGNEGRSTWRRMNRYEYENTLRDILEVPWVQVREMLPEDGTRHRFNKVSDALDVSHVHMARYWAAAEAALTEAMLPSVSAPRKTVQRFYTRRMGSFVGPASFDNFNSAPERATFPMIGNTCDIPALEGKAPMTVGDSDPARRDEEAMGVVASAYEPLEPVFDRFRAPVAGKYRLRFSAYSFWAGPESERRWWRPSRHKLSIGRTREPVSVYAQLPPRQLRLLGGFDVGPEKNASVADAHFLDVWLQKGETIRPDAARLFRSRPPGWRNPLAEADGQPGVAFRWLEVEGPIVEEWPTPGYRVLFGDLPVNRDPSGRIRAVPRDPDTDSVRLIRSFLRRVWRGPVTDDDVARYGALAAKARVQGLDFTDSQLAAYAGILCAPSFVTLEEHPGPLDSRALASRLSYFLWNTEPDERLRWLASRGKLVETSTLEGETKRLLRDDRAGRMVEGFLDYWLDLRKVGIVSPDEILYPDYYLDDYLVESSVAETRATFREMIRANRPARELVDARWSMLNDRLAQHYGIPGVVGAGFRKVTLPQGSVRGGLLTQASVLKVTANGTTTSPVLRGVWVTERILGRPVPPPPKTVPAVEPDIRGASTIRQQLAKHTSDPSCGGCHVRIDPPGYALENFDVFGGWRDRYRALAAPVKMEGRGKNGQPFTFGAGLPVDASGVLPDGRRFRDIRELKALIAADERQVARNLINQLVVYATGAPVRFGERPAVESILDQAKPTGYGVESLMVALVRSPLFRSK
jgi:hypothetical protein